MEKSTRVLVTIRVRQDSTALGWAMAIRATCSHRPPEGVKSALLLTTAAEGVHPAREQRAAGVCAACLCGGGGVCVCHCACVTVRVSLCVRASVCREQNLGGVAVQPLLQLPDLATDQRDETCR